MTEAGIEKLRPVDNSLPGARMPSGFVSRLAGLDLPLEAFERIQELEAQGLQLDQYGLVVLRTGRAIEDKIAADLTEVRQRVGQALADGKHVLYTPGSYDLVHAGHAAYVMECVDLYLEGHPGLTRDDLYVVALADDDMLVEGVKPVHLLAAERWDKEHEERHPRPIQRTDYFGHMTSIHPRLLDLASLPVNLVGLIPNPITFGSTVLGTPLFREWLSRGRDVSAAGAEEDINVRKGIQKYKQLMQLLSSDDYGKVVESFNRARLNLGYDKETAVWDVRSWQLLMHRYLGDVQGGEFQERYVRLISDRDEKYKDEAAKIMNLCGINHMFLHDFHLVSTTALLEQFGWKVLLEAKQHSMDCVKELLPRPDWRRA